MSSSLLKSIAATLVTPRVGVVVILLAAALILALVAPAASLRAAQPVEIAQVRLPTPTPNPAQEGGTGETITPEIITPEIITESSAQQPTAIPSVADPVGTVLVERLRLRAGPGEEHPILERTFPGDLLALRGQTNGCTWLFVTSPSGQQGWVSGESALISINVGCALLPPVDFIVSTPTVSPTPTATREPTATRTATPTRTPTPLAAPEIALRPAISPWTPTPVPTPTRRATATSVAASTAVIAIQPTRDPFAAIAAVGPQSASNLLPVTGTETRQRIPFSWQTDVALAPGQVFEVAFWQRGEPQEEAHGWTGSTTNYTLSANTYEQIPGDYYWGVWLGATVDGTYQRLRYLGGGNLLRVLPEAEVEVAPPAATNCPPTAPCK